MDIAKPGDRITLTGIYKLEGVRVNPRIRMIRSVYKTFIDAIHIAMEERSPLFSVKATTPEDDTMLSQEESPPEHEEDPLPVRTIFSFMHCLCACVQAVQCKLHRFKVRICLA